MSDSPQTANNYEPPLAAAVTGNEKGGKSAAAITESISPFPGVVPQHYIEIMDQPPLAVQLEQNILHEKAPEQEQEPEPEEELDDQEEEADELEEEGEQEK